MGERHQSRGDLVRRRWAFLAAPIVPALVLLTLGAVFVGVRLQLAAHGELASFIVVGTRLTTVEQLPSPRVPVNPGGYDGEFYYRFAVDPTDLSTSAHGIRLDSPVRRQRIGYSLLAWAVAGGRAAAVPTALVAVNLLGLAVAGLFGGLLAQELGRHPLWGLLPAGYFGLVTTLARDLTEITALAFALAGLLALHRRRPLWAAFALAGATLCRETALVIPAALALTRLVALARRQARPAAVDLAWVVPLAAWGGWQVVCAVRYGQPPVLSGGTFVGVPLAALATATVRWVSHPAALGVLQLLQLAALAFVIVAGLRALATSRALPVERVAFVLAVLLLLSLSGDVWTDDPAVFRTMTDTWALGTIVLLGSPGAPVVVPAAVTALLWTANAVLRATAL